MRFNSVKHAVEAYLSRGFRVIPIHGVDAQGDCTCNDYPCRDRQKPGKHEYRELDGKWKDGHVFTVDDFIEGMNVALALGPWKDSRWLVCIDIDGADDASPFFRPLPPRTLTQKSPRGLHLFYTVPEYTPLGCWNDAFETKRAGFALDIRYARGKVNVAPSRTPHGEYEWIDWRAPVPLPPYCLDTILAVRRNRGLPVAERWDRGEKRP